MKYHFFGSLEGDKRVYKKIFSVMKKIGFTPVADHVFERAIDDVKQETPEESQRYVRKMNLWVKKADFIIADATVQGISTGYEIMVALQKGKPVIVIYDISKSNEPNTLKGV